MNYLKTNRYSGQEVLLPTTEASNLARRDVFIASLICFVLGLLFTIATSAYNIVRFPDRDFNPFAGPLVLGGLFFLMGILVICCGRSVHPTPKNIFYAITDRRVTDSI